MKIKPFYVFQKYLSFKKHFTTSYDYFKYNGKSKVSQESYLKRKDKFFFERFSKKYDEKVLDEIFLSNFIYDENFWIGNREYEKNHKLWKKNMLSITYSIKNELDNLVYENFIDLIKSKENQYPVLLDLYISGNISIEFITVCDILFNVVQFWEKKYPKDIVIESKLFRVKKYKPFLKQKIDIDKMKQIFKDSLT